MIPRILPSGKTVIGVDVGGRNKGFHAVALRRGQLEPRAFPNADAAAEWCLAQKPEVIAIDAPCAWAAHGRSRLAERTLAVAGETVRCFMTPTRAAAVGNPFFDWVFHGEELYLRLQRPFLAFDGGRRRRSVVIETFPHAVACALQGRVVPARPKAQTRRGILRDLGFNVTPLANIDFIDAALCAVAAAFFAVGSFRAFGDQAEGFIIIPA